MDFMQQIGGILQQYMGREPDQSPSTVDDDFDEVARTAPRETVAEGLNEAFRSDRTPPFSQMAANIFSRSGGQEKAGILNMLISALGPTVVAQVSGGRGGSILGNILNGGKKEVTPEEAEQVSPEEAKELAERAEQTDSSIIDKISDFYAENPTLVKTLGGAALTIALSKIASRHSGLFR